VLGTQSSFNSHFSGWDDDFDTDNGFSGKVQFCLGVRNPGIADQSISNGFESETQMRVAANLYRSLELP